MDPINYCKFCTLLNLSVEDIKYEDIVDAILQIADNITAKQKFDNHIKSESLLNYKRTTAEQTQTILNLRKSRKELNEQLLSQKEAFSSCQKELDESRITVKQMQKQLDSFQKNSGKVLDSSIFDKCKTNIKNKSAKQ